MAGDVEVHPGGPRESRLPARDIRDPEDEGSAGPEAAPDIAQSGERVREMFEDMEHDHEVKERCVPDRIEVADEHRHVACRARGLDGAFATDRLPATLSERAEHPARAGAKLEGDATPGK